MPDARHIGALAFIARAAGNAANSDGDGKGAANDNAGTEGACVLCVDADCCAQCHVHSAGDCFACAIDMPWQCTIIAASLAGMSAAAQTYEASASCWNNNDNTTSSVSRSRVRREGRGSRFTMSL